MNNKQSEARKILTSIKLGSTGDQKLYNIIWGILDGNYTLSQDGNILTNSEALKIIENKLKEV